MLPTPMALSSLMGMVTVPPGGTMRLSASRVTPVVGATATGGGVAGGGTGVGLDLEPGLEVAGAFGPVLLLEPQLDDLESQGRDVRETEREEQKEGQLGHIVVPAAAVTRQCIRS